MKLGIASDHAGYVLKEKLKSVITSLGHTLEDLGPYSEQSVDYADYAHPLASAVEEGKYDMGIALCGSGNGINMTLNKHQGIRSAICWNRQIAELARQHNNANICTIPARFISEEEAVEVIKIFLATSFEGGRHKTRIDKIPYRCCC